MTPLPITLCGPILHTLALGLFREPLALRGTKEKILLPLPNETLASVCLSERFISSDTQAA